MLRRELSTPMDDGHYFPKLAGNPGYHRFLGARRIVASEETNDTVAQGYQDTLVNKPSTIVILQYVLVISRGCSRSTCKCQ